MDKNKLYELMRAIIVRGMQIDLTGTSIHHTHTKIDSSAVRPPMKLHFCTSALRADARMTQEDVVAIGDLCWQYIQDEKLPVHGLASVPRVGDEIAKALQKSAARSGVTVPRLSFTKIDREGVSYIGPLIENEGYQPGLPVWIIDDLVQKGLSKQRMIARIREAGYIVAGILVFMDYGQGAKEYFEKQGVELRSVTTLPVVLEEGLREGLLEKKTYLAIHEYLAKTKGAAIE